jgi:glutathione S-transferase
MFPMLLTLIMGTVIKETPIIVRPVPYIIRRELNSRLINHTLKDNFDLIEAHLSKNEWFAGPQISGADIQMSFPVEAASERMSEYIGEKTRAWLDKVHSRAAYAKALEKGGEFEISKL